MGSFRFDEVVRKSRREGAASPRTVVTEFPSLKAALACHNSSEYQAARALGDLISEIDLIIVEGYHS